MSVNKAILIGRLGNDPELTQTPNGKAVCKFSMATSEKWTAQDGEKKEKTVWHNIVIWGRPGEVAHEYLRKGSQLYVEGSIDNRTYDKKDGSGKGYTSEINVRVFDFIGSRSDGGDKKESTEDDDLPF